ncbi:hypothetical protein [Zhongshania aquimaris]|uniref:Uncharacterized protein n=1 Tax=Zhongshania aquimaris TaxID=2857107 RepID=A0ABS6VTT4_9GAMM|nr:hypothetical protein [Zhongshania aquimaris]MBW2941734.1 hypothetical protein [Zhongshania aquimaris]
MSRIQISQGIRIIITACLAATSLSAYADRLQNVLVQDSSGKGTQALICLGDKTSPARYGGIYTGDDGRASILLPEFSGKREIISQFHLSASGKAGGTTSVQFSDKIGKELRLTLIEDKKVECASFKPAPLKPVNGYPGVERILALPPEDKPLSPSQVDALIGAAKLGKITRISDYYKGGSKAATTTTPPADANRNIEERCFGAAGSQCGFAGGQNGISTCLPVFGINGFVNCRINDGSWNHDECCVRNPNGFLCGGEPAGPGAACTAEFNAAFAVNLTPFSWNRLVNINTIDRDGRVDRPLYCAKSGSIVFSDQASLCCDGSRALNVFDVAAFTNRNGAWIPALPFTRICK